MKFGIVTSEGELARNTDDLLLQTELGKVKLKSEFVVWDDPTIDWSLFESLIVRSIWDYTEKYDAFSSWLKYIDGTCTIINDLELLRWNSDKRYLLELQLKGIPVIPTRIVPGWSVAEFNATLQNDDWKKVVLKSSVSADGINLFIVDRGIPGNAEDALAQMKNVGSLLIQEFDEAIVNRGEYSVIYIDGEYTHTIHKTAAIGEFRIQSRYGGKEALVPNRQELLELSQKVIGLLTKHPMYARTDIIVSEEFGPRVIEVELIEPDLFLRFNENALHKLAIAIKRSLDNP